MRRKLLRGFKFAARQVSVPVASRFFQKYMSKLQLIWRAFLPIAFTILDINFVMHVVCNETLLNHRFPAPDVNAFHRLPHG